MLKKLLEVERILPKLLRDESAWTGLYADTEQPHLQRLWRQFGEHRLYLHHFEMCTREEAFAHPHPWPAAMRILRGSYEMSVGPGNAPARDAEGIVTVVLRERSTYEMVRPDAWHRVRPILPCYTFMVAGPPIWQENRVKAQRAVRELTRQERAFMFFTFREFYPHH